MGFTRTTTPPPPMTQSPDQPAPDAHWLLHGDLPCLGCQYNLRGLVGPTVKCPECGHLNDLRDPTPWRTKKLPTGELVREHWPASAALASFAVMVTLPVMLVTTGTALLRNAFPIVGLIALAAFVLIVTWWMLSCIRWLRSCSWGLWGWSILMGTHLAMWGTLVGAVGCFAFFADPRGMLVTSPLLAVVLIASVTGLFWLRSLIRRADRTGQFRSDWRKWQLPTGEPDNSADPPV
ncbi:hypothetical protein ACERK3_00525 [Phycisphaerales bacterium AB-hyl4]|uniref:LSD1 subclass zinc finger protein n=1 Tax=Natronomicrosphaera hydrolytica TaxID=3242702 RepID=A0ABV4TZK0_9BACT